MIGQVARFTDEHRFDALSERHRVIERNGPVDPKRVVDQIGGVGRGIVFRGIGAGWRFAGHGLVARGAGCLAHSFPGGRELTGGRRCGEAGKCAKARTGYCSSCGMRHEAG